MMLLPGTISRQTDWEKSFSMNWIGLSDELFPIPYPQWK